MHLHLLHHVIHVHRGALHGRVCVCGRGHCKWKGGQYYWRSGHCDGIEHALAGGMYSRGACMVGGRAWWVLWHRMRGGGHMAGGMCVRPRRDCTAVDGKHPAEQCLLLVHNIVAAKVLFVHRRVNILFTGVTW